MESVVPEKLRDQGSLGGANQLYIQTNIFKQEAPQYQRSMTVPLSEASADSRVLTAWALRVPRPIYLPGFGYHKDGITLMEMVPKSNQQFSLFVPTIAEKSRNEHLMTTLDAIN